jgi:hypothetical protein
MENSRKVEKNKVIALLGVIGLVVGIVGLSLGGVALVNIASLESKIGSVSNDSHTHNGWYNRVDSAVYTNPNFTLMPITALTITFDLGPDEGVYISYMALAGIFPLSSSSFIGITFRVNGVHLFFPYMSFSVSNMSAEGHFSTISLQLYKDDLSEGIHNVTVDVLGSHDGNYVNLNTLYVQKYPL